MAAGRAGPSNPRQPSPSECPPASEGFGSPLPVPQAQVSGAEGRAGAGGSAGQASVPECRRSQLLLGRRKEAPAYLRHGSREGPSTGKRGTAGRRGRGPEARAACAVPRGRVPRAATACPLPSSRGRGAPSCRGGGSGKPSLPCSPGPACSNGVTGRRLLCDPGKVREVLGAPDRAAAPGHLTGIPVRAWWAPVPTSRTRRPPSAPRPGSPQPATRKPRLSATQGRERWTRP